jgi:hypothetical protein
MSSLPWWFLLDVFAREEIDHIDHVTWAHDPD